MYNRLVSKVKKLEKNFTRIKKNFTCKMKCNQEIKVDNEEMNKDVNKKNVEISKLSSDVYNLRNKMKEISYELDKQHQILNDKNKEEDIISKAKNILEMNKIFEEFIDKVCTVKDEMKTTYAQIFKAKNEIKEK